MHQFLFVIDIQHHLTIFANETIYLGYDANLQKFNSYHMDKPDDLTLSRNVLETVAIASEFCLLAEDSGKVNKDDMARSLGSFIPLLYLRGTLLPDIVPEYPEANERFVAEEQWENIFTLFREKFGQDDRFRYLDSPDTSASETEIGSISECIADIYQDLKDFVLLYKRNQIAARENAIHSVRLLFKEHWGLLLLRLMPVFHEINYNQKTPETEHYSL